MDAARLTSLGIMSPRHRPLGTMYPHWPLISSHCTHKSAPCFWLVFLIMCLITLIFFLRQTDYRLLPAQPVIKVDRCCNFDFQPETNFPHFSKCVRAVLGRYNGHGMVRSYHQILETKQDIHVMIVGGSETAGVGCEEHGLNFTRTLKTCAWSARLGRSHSQLYPKKNFFIQNLAAGGSTISVGLPVLGTWLASKPDLLLVDFTVNDCAEIQTTLHPLLALYEAWILKAIDLGYGLKMAFLVSSALEKCRGTRNVIEFAAGLHDVPVFDYFDVAQCASSVSQLDLTTVYWDADTHPSWKAHQAMSDMLSMTLLPYNFPEVDESFTNVSEFADLDFCSVPISMYDAFNPPGNDSGIVNTNWSLFEDRQGKPGWISSSSNATISFHIKFGQAPRLTVVWLRSYEQLGDAVMVLNGRIVRLPGLYSAADVEHGLNISQSFMLTFQASHEANQAESFGLTAGLVGFGVLPYSEHDLIFSTSIDTLVNGCSKFKIIQISTC